MKKSLLLLIALAVFTVSCKKETLNENTPIRTSSIASDEDVYDLMLEVATYGLLEISRDPVFKDIVNAKVAEQFDGDDNALLKDINLSAIDLNINLPLSMQASIVNHASGNGVPHDLASINQAINGFSYFGENAFVQVYIPFVELVDLNADPIIVINPNDSDILTGYYLDNANNLVTVTVDEDYAMQNLVWVISVNERVDSAGNYNEEQIIPMSARYLKLKKVYIKDKKENWGNGKGDLHWVRAVFNDCISNHPYMWLKTFKINKNDLNTWKTVTGDLVRITDNATKWMPSESIAIVIYERDRRRKFEKTYQYRNCATGNLLHYVAKEDAYMIKIFNHSDFPQNPTTKVFNNTSGDFEFEAGLN